MKKIKLTRGMYAIVDDADYEWLSKYKWNACPTGRDKWVAKTWRCEKSKTIHMYMHRMIMNPPSDMLIDHKDGNPLNNTRENLRICDKYGNARNTRKPITNTSGYKGVTYDGWRGAYKAQIQCHDTGKIYLGSFKRAEDAAMAYDLKAVELFGEFANINFPNRKINADKLAKKRIKSKDVFIEYMGETKRLYEWSQDKRCPVAPDTFVMRLWKGWTMQEAMTHKTNGRYLRKDNE